MSNHSVIDEINNLLASKDEEKIYEAFFHFLSSLKELEKKDDQQYRTLEAAEWILQGNIEESMSEVYESIDHVVAEKMSEIKQFINGSDELEKSAAKKDLEYIVEMTLFYRGIISEYFEDIDENVSMRIIPHGDVRSDEFNGPMELVLSNGNGRESFYYNEHGAVNKFIELYLHESPEVAIAEMIG